MSCSRIQYALSPGPLQPYPDTAPRGQEAIAPAPAGTVHSDFERGFIKAETVNWADLVRESSVGHARETGHYRIEGRDYVVRDGDVLLFKVSV